MYQHKQSEFSPCDQRLIGLLVAYDCALLQAICHTNYVGETAAIIAKGIVLLLNYQGAVFVEDFLIRMFRIRMIDYGKLFF